MAGTILKRLTVKREVKFSVEFFPPTEEAIDEICGVVRHYVSNYPIEHISITHGAAGSKKDKSLAFINALVEKEIVSAKNITAHLSCAGLSKREVIDYVSKFYNLGIREILAIKGDPTSVMAEDGYASTSEAIIDIKKEFKNIEILAACFPEPRTGVASEVDILREKIAGGADRFISQFCFENEFFKSFYDELKASGIDNEIIIGLIIPSPQTLSFAQKCYAKVPDYLHDIANNKDRAVNFVVDQLKFLENVGFKSVHLYSLNKLGCTKVLESYLNKK